MGTSKTSKHKTVGWPIEPATSEAQPPEDKASDDRPAGRIVHDARGNAVWNWAGTGGGDAARISVDSTSAMLKRLELPGLKVEGQEDTAVVPKVDEANGTPAAAQPQPDANRGYNPYDQHKAIRKPTAPKAPVKHKP